MGRIVKVIKFSELEFACTSIVAPSFESLRPFFVSVVCLLNDPELGTKKSLHE